MEPSLLMEAWDALLRPRDDDDGGGPGGAGSPGGSAGAVGGAGNDPFDVASRRLRSLDGAAMRALSTHALFGGGGVEVEAAAGEGGEGEEGQPADAGVAAATVFSPPGPAALERRAFSLAPVPATGDLRRLLLRGGLLAPGLAGRGMGRGGGGPPPPAPPAPTLAPLAEEAPAVGALADAVAVDEDGDRPSGGGPPAGEEEAVLAVPPPVEAA